MEINWISVVIATLIPSILGFIYYSKPLFGKAWMSSIGMTEEKMKSANMPVMMIVSIIMSFFIAFFMMGFCNGAGQEGQFDTFKHGAAHGTLISIFFVIPIFITKGLFHQTKWKTMLINGLYWMICLALMGGVLDAMNHWNMEIPAHGM
ncbi:MAG: DUF1761 domain-containing protein [Flavobacteriales bacterium]|nr:DUF1761 domain-containing protein [Flavobacteriales bacterium]